MVFATLWTKISATCLRRRSKTGNASLAVRTPAMRARAYAFQTVQQKSPAPAFLIPPNQPKPNFRPSFLNPASSTKGEQDFSAGVGPVAACQRRELLGQ